MSKQFEFRKNELELDFAGKIFVIDPLNKDVLNGLSAFEKEVQELQGRDNSIETVEKMFEVSQQVVDSVLGKGATAAIFEGRKIKYLDILDVIEYIVSEVDVFRENQEKKYSPNRLTRRATSKKAK